MTDKERYEKAKKKAEERAKELFRPVPDDVKKELEKENVLGTTDSLVDRSDEEE